MENSSNMDLASSAGDENQNYLSATSFSQRLDYLEDWIKNERKLSRLADNREKIGFEYTCPLLLNTEEQANPLMILKNFFSAHDLLEVKSWLKIWFKTALTENIKYENGSELLFFHNQLIQLFNSGYQIAQNGNSAMEANLIPHLQSEESLISCLDDAERENPIKYLKATLNLPNIIDLRFGMQEWLYSALSVRSSINEYDTKFIFIQFELLEKLVEAMFLIHAATSKK
ncbi:hypothetical protein DHW03_11440 [Pedobacter yonginense]|uniref:Uncharacterized protein n=1 Tax=Pedobacter yonginense TaxID=651869 RepID=A0A317EPP7_9SPHI|nr:hypothetical protein [Pedobacter yonginense]PWS28157.1 hypothetical protein DHW03_11440 [Pedobacter yonginense]